MKREHLADLPFVHRFARYFVVGGVSFAISWCLFTALFYLGMHYLPAEAIAFVLATAFNYALSIRFVFRSGHHSKKTEIALVYLVSGVGLLIDLAALAGLVELAGLHPLIAKVGAVAVGFGWNFAARHLWVFPT